MKPDEYSVIDDGNAAHFEVSPAVARTTRVAAVPRFPKRIFKYKKSDVKEYALVVCVDGSLKKNFLCQARTFFIYYFPSNRVRNPAYAIALGVRLITTLLDLLSNFFRAFKYYFF